MYVTWYFAIAAYPFLTSKSVARRSYRSVGQFYWLCYLFLDTFRWWTRFSFSLSSEVKRSLGAYSLKSSDSAHGYSYGSKYQNYDRQSNSDDLQSNFILRTKTKRRLVHLP